MKIVAIDPTIDTRWDNFIAEQKAATPFHTSAWAKVIHDTYYYQPKYLILENDSGKLTAGMPCFLVSSWLTGKRLVCLPFSDYCYPLSEGGEELNMLIDSLKEEMRVQRASYIEIRGWPGEAISEGLGVVPFRHYLSYIVDLERDVENVRRRFHENVKRCIKQAEKEEMTFRLASDEDDLKQFYRLNVATRKKLGVLPQPYVFFENVFRHVISRGLGFLMLAQYEKRVIAAVLFLTHGSTIYYKFNASDMNYQRKRPNHLLIWESMKYACSRGYRHYDFGRCNPEEKGLMAFKRKWGARELDLPYYYYPRTRGLSKHTEINLGYRMMQLTTRIMPKFVFTATGSVLYKHLG
jgi:lipid II:glycine glycyltransferase (peptidoglycan interpeptide bridge formation enzyme)